MSQCSSDDCIFKLNALLSHFCLVDACALTFPLQMDDMSSFFVVTFTILSTPLRAHGRGSFESEYCRFFEKLIRDQINPVSGFFCHAVLLVRASTHF